MMPKYWLISAEFALRRKRSILGFMVAVSGNRLEKARAFANMEQALKLFQKYAPVRFDYTQQDVKRILVSGGFAGAGIWIRSLDMIELQAECVNTEDAWPEAIACLIIHEATHARLERLGFGYSEKQRIQIERVCIRSERFLARRIPNSEELVAWCDKCLMGLKQEQYTDIGLAASEMSALRKAGCPEWIVERLIKRYERISGLAPGTLALAEKNLSETPTQ